MSPVGDYDELLGLRYTATDLVLEFGIFLWACGTLCNGDLMYKNSCYGGSWDFIRNTCSREGLGLSASGWVSSPHQVPGGVRGVNKRQLVFRNRSSERFESFSFICSSTDQASNTGSMGKVDCVEPAPPDSSHKLAFSQTFYFDVSQVYSKGEENNALHIYMLFIWKIQLTLYHIFAGLFPFFLHSLHIHTFFPPKSSRSELQRS